MLYWTVLQVAMAVASASVEKEDILNVESIYDFLFQE